MSTDGLGKTNFSQRVNLTRSLRFSLVLLDQDLPHMLERKHFSVSKRKALAGGDDSGDSGHDYLRPPRSSVNVEKVLVFFA